MIYTKITNFLLKAIAVCIFIVVARQMFVSGVQFTPKLLLMILGFLGFVFVGVSEANRIQRKGKNHD